MTSVMPVLEPPRTPPTPDVALIDVVDLSTTISVSLKKDHVYAFKKDTDGGKACVSVAEAVEYLGWKQDEKKHLVDFVVKTKHRVKKYHQVFDTNDTDDNDSLQSLRPHVYEKTPNKYGSCILLRKGGKSEMFISQVKRLFDEYEINHVCEVCDGVVFDGSQMHGYCMRNDWDPYAESSDEDLASDSSDSSETEEEETDDEEEPPKKKTRV